MVSSPVDVVKYFFISLMRVDMQKKGSSVKTKSINRCGTCSKTFNFKSELKRHLESKKKRLVVVEDRSKEWIILKNTC